MRCLGKAIGQVLSGGEVVELVGDIGAGKTTLTKGIGEGLGITEPIQSPTFTISRTYDSPRHLRLFHYDFYRLHEAGIMSQELEETMTDARSVVVIEWADTVGAVLPEDRLTIAIDVTGVYERIVSVTAGGTHSAAVWQKVKELMG